MNDVLVKADIRFADRYVPLPLGGITDAWYFVSPGIVDISNRAKVILDGEAFQVSIQTLYDAAFNLGLQEEASGLQDLSSLRIYVALKMPGESVTVSPKGKVVYDERSVKALLSAFANFFALLRNNLQAECHSFPQNEVYREFTKLFDFPRGSIVPSTWRGQKLDELVSNSSLKFTRFNNRYNFWEVAHVSTWKTFASFSHQLTTRGTRLRTNGNNLLPEIFFLPIRKKAEMKAADKMLMKSFPKLDIPTGINPALILHGDPDDELRNFAQYEEINLEQFATLLAERGF